MVADTDDDAVRVVAGTTSDALLAGQTLTPGDVYLVAGDKTGKAKLDQAKKTGTRVISEAQMETLLRGETLPA